MSSQLDDIIKGLQQSLAHHTVAVSQLELMTHTNLVLVAMALVDQALRMALEKRMVPLSSTMKRTLFEGYGTLAHLGDRMDVCFAFGLIDQPIYLELKLLNQIRIKFAHSPQTRSFADKSIVDLVKQLPSKPNRDYAAMGSCQEVIKDVLNHLTAHLDSAASSP